MRLLGSLQAAVLLCAAAPLGAQEVGPGGGEHVIEELPLARTCVDYCRCLAADLLQCITDTIPGKPNYAKDYYLFRVNPMGLPVYYQFDFGTDSWQLTVRPPPTETWTDVEVPAERDAMRQWIDEQHVPQSPGQPPRRVSDADLDLASFLAQFRPHPGAASATSTCRPSRPDAAGAARGCYMRTGVEEGGCSQNDCAVALAHHTERLALSMSKAAAAIGDVGAARARTALAADLLSLDDGLAPAMQLLEAGMKWNMREEIPAAAALLCAVPVVGTYAMEAKALMDSPNVARIGKMLNDDAVRGLLAALGEHAAAAQLQGPTEAAQKAVRTATPVLRVYTSLRYFRDSGELYRSDVRAKRWEDAAQRTDDLRRHLSGTAGDICGNVTGRPAVWTLLEATLIMMKEFRMPWLHSDVLDAALLQLDCMCVQQPYAHHASLGELQECAQQIAAVVYGVHVPRLGSKDDGRKGGFRRAKLAGLGTPRFDTSALDEADYFATHKGAGKGAPAVALGMASSLIRVLPEKEEEDLWRRQAHALSEAESGRLGALIDQRGTRFNAEDFLSMDSIRSQLVPVVVPGAPRRRAPFSTVTRP